MADDWIHDAAQGLEKGAKAFSKSLGDMVITLGKDIERWREEHPGEQPPAGDGQTTAREADAADGEGPMARREPQAAEAPAAEGVGASAGADYKDESPPQTPGQTDGGGPSSGGVQAGFSAEVYGDTQTPGGATAQDGTPHPQDDAGWTANPPQGVAYGLPHREPYYVSRGESIFGLVFLILVLYVFNFAPQWMGAVGWQDGVSAHVPLLNIDVWNVYLPAINVLMVVSIVRESVKLAFGRWTWPLCLVGIGQNLAAIGLFGSLFFNPALINWDLAAQCAATFPHWSPGLISALARIPEFLYRWAGWIAILVCVIEIIVLLVWMVQLLLRRVR